jgi:hypothetical protein
MVPIAAGNRLTTLERMVQAVELVRERLLRATGALEAAQIPYAVVGGNAVGAWVAQVNRRAVRNTVNVDILLQAEDLPAAAEALRQAGFVYRHAAGIDFFLDGPDGDFAEAVHIVKADAKVRKEYLLPAPSVEESCLNDEFRLITLEALVRMKLTSFRKKDQVHLEDLIGVGLVDPSWLERVPVELSERLQKILDEYEPPPDFR